MLCHFFCPHLSFFLVVNCAIIIIFFLCVSFCFFILVGRDCKVVGVVCCWAGDVSTVTGQGICEVVVWSSTHINDHQYVDGRQGLAGHC